MKDHPLSPVAWTSMDDDTGGVTGSFLGHVARASGTTKAAALSAGVVAATVVVPSAMRGEAETETQGTLPPLDIPKRVESAAWKAPSETKMGTMSSKVPKGLQTTYTVGTQDPESMSDEDKQITGLLRRFLTLSTGGRTYTTDAGWGQECSISNNTVTGSPEFLLPLLTFEVMMLEYLKSSDQTDIRIHGSATGDSYSVYDQEKGFTGRATIEQLVALVTLKNSKGTEHLGTELNAGNELQDKFGSLLLRLPLNSTTSFTSVDGTPAAVIGPLKPDGTRRVDVQDAGQFAKVVDNSGMYEEAVQTVSGAHVKDGAAAHGLVSMESTGVEGVNLRLLRKQPTVATSQ